LFTFLRFLVEILFYRGNTMAYPFANQDVVSELVQLEKQYQNFTAIPNSWYSHLLDAKGQVYSDAILVLAEIINWYRLIPIYDRSTKKIIGYQKKFKLDLLQKSYKDFEDKFCFSKEKTRRILNFLIQKKLIYKEMRTLKSKSLVLSNVMFIGIHVENINKLNETSHKNDGVVYHFLPEKVTPSCKNTPPLVTNLVRGSTKNLTTYTEITPEITNTINESLKEKSVTHDWSLTFSKEENLFLEELLAIKPYQGKPIEKNSATWWIKFFGIEAIKTAVAVYWQRVQYAKIAPKEIGACIRDALNKKTPVYRGPLKKKAHSEAVEQPKSINCKSLTAIYEVNSATLDHQKVDSPLQAQLQAKPEISFPAEPKLPTHSMPSQAQKAEDSDFLAEMESMSQSELEAMLKAEIEAIYQPKDTALTDNLQKEQTSQIASQNQLQANTQANTQDKPETAPLLQKAIRPSQTLSKALKKPMIAQTARYNPFKSNTQRFIALNEDEKKYLDNLLNYKPVLGDSIPEREATWWVKSYGIAKIKTAVQVYIQQVEKSLKNSKVEMPRSMGAYVRNALDKDLRPCLEHEKRNKRFAEEFKEHVNWTSLVIIEKYCRAEHTSKEWFYTMSEEEFRNALKDSYYNNFVDQKMILSV
jgi:hypothetical protein